MTNLSESGKSVLPKGMEARSAHVIFLGVAAVLFSLAQSSIVGVTGWWNDELYALWASDPTAPFAAIFSERIAPDTNPPLYFSALYGVRSFVSDDRVAILVLNIVCLVAAGLAVLLVSRCARLTGLALLGLAAFLLSGPVLLYAPEGRAYLPALCVSFLAAWCAALSIEEKDSRPSSLTFATLGVLAALIHVYAALFCGALAACLLALALFDTNRRYLVGPGFALGLSASIALGVWLLTVTDSVERIDWIQFTPAVVKTAVWYVKELTVGARWVGLLLALLLVFGLLHRSTRALVLAFGVAYAAFIALPLLASLKHPMIMGRYWVIGAPGLIVLVTFLGRAWFWEFVAGSGSWAVPYAIASVGVLALASGIFGFLAARAFTESKPIWNGAEVAAPLLQGCPAGSVHVGSGQIGMSRANPDYFAKVAGASSALFVDVGKPETATITAVAVRCPVMGWAEHVLLGEDYLVKATDDQLLRLLKIDAAPGEVDIRRSKSGFVVLGRR